MASIGFVLSHEQFPAARLIELGVKAEKAGFDMIWTSDHFQPWQDNQGHSGQAWVTLAALGQRMHTIPMGTGVTCPTYRYHPSVVAQAFASLGALYPGRVFLGVGTGEALNEQAATGDWGDYDERSERFIEAVQLIRELWSGEWISHQGKYYQVPQAKLYTLPQQPIPMYLAASGPESMGIAGTYGDGLITDAETALMPEMRQKFIEAAESAGKVPDAMTIHAELFIFVGNRDDAAKAAEKWRFLPKAWDPYVNNPDPREIQRLAQQEVPIEQVLDKMVIGEDPQTHIEKIQELMEGGVTHIYVHSAQEDQDRAIDFYAKQVLPKVQHERMRLDPNVIGNMHGVYGD
jgi:F420-dependent hydroxymycolic acid dehydrogenase